VLAPQITSMKIVSAEEDAVLRPGGPAKMVLDIKR
jgi:hypothetical protein